MLLAFGSNSHGQLATGEAADHHTPVPALFAQTDQNSLHPHSNRPARCLSGGSNHTAVVTADGTLLTAGLNDKGQLGFASSTPSVYHLTPADCVSTLDFVWVACGWDSTLAVTSSGEVWACGCNRYGQLGLGRDIQSSPTLVRVPEPTLQGVTKVACGIRHAVALGKNGEVWAWGSNKYGEAGVEDTTDDAHSGAAGDDSASAARKTRRKKTNSPNVVYQPARMWVPDCLDIACGQHHTVVLTRGGIIVAFGRNRHGQLGVNPDVLEYSPKGIKTSLFRYVNEPPLSVFCGWGHTGALLPSGRVFMWGRNDHAQLSWWVPDSDKFPSDPIPICWQVVEAPGLKGISVRRVVSGPEHLLAVDKEGRCYSWGWNEHGNCGVGGTDDVREPTLIDVGTRVQVVGSGYGHSVIWVEGGSMV